MSWVNCVLRQFLPNGSLLTMAAAGPSSLSFRARVQGRKAGNKRRKGKFGPFCPQPRERDSFWLMGCGSDAAATQGFVCLFLRRRKDRSLVPKCPSLWCFGLLVSGALGLPPSAAIFFHTSSLALAADVFLTFILLLIPGARG